jgi:hypothetical protein
MPITFVETSLLTQSEVVARIASKELRSRLDQLIEEMSISPDDLDEMIAEMMGVPKIVYPSRFMTVSDIYRVMDYLNSNYERLGKEGRERRWKF